MWVAFAFLSALSASAVAILGKLGLKTIDSTLATTVRAAIMTVFLAAVSLGLGKFKGFSLESLSQKDWILIALSGIAGALSWLFYFFAIKHGVTTTVVSIDKLSVVLVVIMAALFLGEAFTWKVGIGASLMTAGAILIALK